MKKKKKSPTLHFISYAFLFSWFLLKTKGSGLLALWEVQLLNSQRKMKYVSRQPQERCSEGTSPWFVPDLALEKKKSKVPYSFQDVLEEI